MVSKLLLPLILSRYICKKTNGKKISEHESKEVKERALGAHLGQDLCRKTAPKAEERDAAQVGLKKHRYHEEQENSKGQLGTGDVPPTIHVVPLPDGECCSQCGWQSLYMMQLCLGIGTRI